MDTIQPMFFIQVQNCLTIAACFERMSFRFKPRTQLNKVVDFSVDKQNKRFVLVVKWLPAASQVDNTQSAHCQGKIWCIKLTFAIWTSVPEDCIHCPYILSILFCKRLSADHTHYSTHGS